jgi:Protein of unknown function (DUF1566)/Divergent InlB B-repeat domain/Fibronectin type III domain
LIFGTFLRHSSALLKHFLRRVLPFPAVFTPGVAMRALLLILFALLSFPVFSSTYTKIANNGVDLPDSALLGSAPTDWACTRDNRSGLLWEVKTAHTVRLWAYFYTNYDDPTQAQKWNGSAYVNPTQAEIDATTNSVGFLKAVNLGGLCGQTDWRMPGKGELANLLDSTYAPGATINPSFFPNTSDFRFWSGSPHANFLYAAWEVDFSSAGLAGYVRDSGMLVRLVRGASSFAAFTLSVNATGVGVGRITGSTGGLNCQRTVGGTCSASLASGTVVTLIATPGDGNSFTGWSGACSGTSTSCTVTLDAAKSVSAAFVLAPSSRYSKVANNGNVLPDSALLGTGPGNWACTRDNTTGLLWEVKTTDGAVRDWNKTYTNYDDPTQAQKWNGSAYVHPTQAEIDAATNSIGFAKAVNASTLCGQNDWRVASKDELGGLVDQGYSPKINPSFFPNSSSSSFFWTSSPYFGYSNSAWVMAYYDSFVRNTAGRSSGYRVRLVHGVASAVAFTLSLGATSNGSGTLTSNTGGMHCTSTEGTTSGTCAASLPSTTFVILTATPSPGSSFTGWGGGCNYTEGSCLVTMDVAKSVTANFNSLPKPGIPTNIVITAGKGSALFSFSSPSDTGGATITRYTASCSASGQTTRTAFGPTAPLTVRNLTAGVEYQCTLMVTNSAGSTSILSASLPVTPNPAPKGNMTPILMLLLD